MDAMSANVALIQISHTISGSAHFMRREVRLRDIKGLLFRHAARLRQAERKIERLNVVKLTSKRIDRAYRRWKERQDAESARMHVIVEDAVRLSWRKQVEVAVSTFDRTHQVANLSQILEILGDLDRAESVTVMVYPPERTRSLVEWPRSRDSIAWAQWRHTSPAMLRLRRAA